MAFKIIPVIDLKNGDVVHAVQGKRNEYKPLATLISDSNELLELCYVFINQYEFKTIYIADLNAITNNGNQHTIIKSLLTTYPEMNLWLDSGLEFLEIDNNYNQCVQILGSEMNFDLLQYQNLRKQYPSSILSLDFSSTRFLGHSDILTNSTVWPETIILMNLDKVGSQQGINFERIQSIKKLLSPQQRLFIAGGIRNESDIKQLESLGIDGALISTSLHNLSINLSTAKKYR